jgi:hypothetical protein
MKREVPPAVAIGVIIAAILIVGVFIYWKTSRGSGNRAEIERIIQSGVVKGPPAGQKGPQSGVMPGSGAPPITSTMPATPR